MRWLALGGKPMQAISVVLMLCQVALVIRIKPAVVDA